LLLAEARADAVAARNDTRDAHPSPRELLRDEHVLEDAEPEAAVLLRDQDPEVPELGHLLAELHRDLALHGVEPVRDRQDLVHRERARRLEDRLALVAVVRRGHALDDAGEQTHHARRFATRFVRRQPTTTSPRWFRPCVSQVTTPKAGRLSDSRFATTTLRAVSVSPG